MMKQLLLIGALTISAIVVLIACGGGNTNVSVNSNSNYNSNSNSNSNGSYIGNAANSVSNAASSMMTASPESFAKDAAEGGMAEVKMGQLAAKNAKDPEVKKFGQMMVTDHSKANDELKALAAKKNYQLPTDIGSHQSTYDKLSKLTGADFDKQYVDEMVDDHETDVKDFQREAENGTDPDVKAFAAKTLPTLQKHLDAIKAIQAKMNNGGTNSNMSGSAANTGKTANKKY
jgi:putative membrane protein